MTNLAVGTQADVMEMASPVIEEQADYEFAGQAIPASLLQIEGLLRVAPDNEQLLLLAAKGWGSYAYGYVEDAMQTAELAGDYERADRERARARQMYLQARGFGFRLLSAWAPEFERAIGRDPDELRAFVEEEFTDPEAAPALFWAGYAWGSAINVSRDNPAMLADLPFPRVLVERAVALDEGYYNAAGHVFLGVFHSSLGESVGGDPDRGKTHFEKALQMTERQVHVVHVNYAQTYAVQKQDRALFVRLLQEVVDAPPGEARFALPNAVAQRRARRLLGQLDDLILPPLPDEPPAPEPGPGPAPPEPPPASAAPSVTAPSGSVPTSSVPTSSVPSSTVPPAAVPSGSPPAPSPKPPVTEPLTVPARPRG